MSTNLPAAERPVRHLRALLGALLLLMALLGFVHGCGNEDLILPGSQPPTPVFTGTPEPTETEEPDEA